MTPDSIDTISAMAESAAIATLSKASLSFSKSR